MSLRMLLGAQGRADVPTGRLRFGDATTQMHGEIIQTAIGRESYLGDNTWALVTVKNQKHKHTIWNFQEQCRIFGKT